MRKYVRRLALGASALVLVLSACTAGGGTAQPTSAPAAKPTEAAKPAATTAAAKPAGSPAAAKPAASPAVVASPAAKPAASPSPAAAKPAASPSPATGAAAATGPKPTVRMGSTNFGEQVLLAELYGQVLEANGYRVERRLNLGNREIVYPAIESGQIDMYPEYLATLLAFVTKSTEKVTDAQEGFTKLQEALRPKGITVLQPAPAIDTNAFAVTRETAERYNLRTMSDLARVSQELVLGAPPECPQRPFCLPGLEQTYGIKFKEFRPLDAGGPLTVAALEGKQIDVALLFSTDAVVAQKGFVVLGDDKKLQSADNVAPIVRTAILDQAPPDFEQAVNSVSAKLTTEGLTELNKQVGVDRREPKDVATAWLRENGLVR